MMGGWVNLAQIGPFLRAQRWCMPRMRLLGLIMLAAPFLGLLERPCHLR